MEEKKRKAPDPQWYTDFWRCQDCGKDCREALEDDAPHLGFGLCAKCLALFRASLKQGREAQHGDTADNQPGAIL